MRNWVSPVQHRSNAQVNHRQAFSSASAMWCTLMDAEKDQWHNYAKDPVRFTPVYKQNTGGINGLNAYLAHKIEVYHQNILQNNVTAISSTPSGLNHSSQTYAVPNIPPSLPVDGTIFGVVPIVSGGITYNTVTGVYTVTLNVAPEGGVTQPFVFPGNTEMKDGHGNNVGLALYISKTKKNTPNFANKLVRKVLATGKISNGTANPLNVTQIQVTATYNPSGNFGFPVQGDYVDVSVVMITYEGQARKVGQFTCQIA